MESSNLENVVAVFIGAFFGSTISPIYLDIGPTLAVLIVIGLMLAVKGLLYVSRELPSRGLLEVDR